MVVLTAVFLILAFIAMLAESAPTMMVFFVLSFVSIFAGDEGMIFPFKRRK